MSKKLNALSKEVYNQVSDLTDALDAYIKAYAKKHSKYEMSLKEAITIVSKSGQNKNTLEYVSATQVVFEFSEFTNSLMKDLITSIFEESKYMVY